jgi:dihydrofolate reductase
MVISLIAAASENNVIGRGGELPWHLPKDLQYYRLRTLGHPIIMGRKTFESIGKPLPGRRNIVVTRRRDFSSQGCDVVHSLEEALALVRDDPSGEVFVIGGGEIYGAALTHVRRIYLTRVHATIEGDAYFPEVDWSEWREVSRERHEADPEHTYAFTFLVFERKG